ncbi:hypothetical protein [Streptomyces sp. AC495_CC817]|uniref:hypothetical protein n=1 Tax=Streptomyces sp. AC495_CC817 TaxID=2823900 RepID=UPI001C27C2D1|nr:hypothetical protein [Streptomyces sp. AC495_CC817]
MSDPQQTPAQPSGAPSPGYPAAQPQYPAGQPYPGPPQSYAGTHPYGSAPYPGGPGAASSGEPLGRTAFVIAVIGAGLSLLLTLLTPVLLGSGNYEALDPVSSGVGIIAFLGYVAALVLGIVSLRRPESNLLAAIAVGIAGSGAVLTAFSWMSSLVWGLF